MLSKLLEKTNPGFRNTLSKLQSYLKTTDISIANQSGTRHDNEKNRLLSTNNKIKQEITRHIDKDTPDFVRKFLHAQWSRLMLKIYLKKGTHDNAWEQSVKIMDELVRLSNDRKSHQDEHNKKMQSLVHRLNKGMSIIPLPPTAREQFLRQLMDYDKAITERLRKAEPRETITGNTGGLFSEELLVDNKKDIKSGFNLNEEM